MTTLQKRRLYFWLGLFAVCALLFLILPWKAVPVILFFLLIFLASPLEELYKLVVYRPVSTPEYHQHTQTEEEWHSYQQGLQPQPVYYQPAIPKDESETSDQPQVEYLQQYR